MQFALPIYIEALDGLTRLCGDFWSEEGVPLPTFKSALPSGVLAGKLPVSIISFFVDYGTMNLEVALVVFAPTIT